MKKPLPFPIKRRTLLPYFTRPVSVNRAVNAQAAVQAEYLQLMTGLMLGKPDTPDLDE